MDLIALSQTGNAVVTLTVVLLMFVLFLRESYPTEVVAIVGVGLLLALGALPYDAALTVLSNPAPWTIAAMFIIMGALVRTGALEAFTSLADATARTNPALAIVMLMTFVGHYFHFCLRIVQISFKPLDGFPLREVAEGSRGTKQQCLIAEGPRGTKQQCLVADGLRGTKQQCLIAEGPRGTKLLS